MKLKTPNKYQLSLKPKKSYEVILTGSERKGFHYPDTIVCPKLYVIKRDQEIHYVGITNRPMSARINYGLKAIGLKGYHGYQWKKLKEKLTLYVWSFPRNQGKNFKRNLETIEAEFAYLVRNTSGNWPLSQTEIHFYSPQKAHTEAAKKMMRQCKSK